MVRIVNRNSVMLSPRQEKQFIADTKKLVKGKDMAVRYGLPGPSSVYRTALRLGFPPRYRVDRRRERRDALLVKIQKGLCKLPNLAEYCRREKLKYFCIVGRSYKLRVRKIKCYVAERQKCRICGEPKSEKSFKRLCETHLMDYNKKLIAGLTRRRTVIREIGKERL